MDTVLFCIYLLTRVSSTASISELVCIVSCLQPLQKSEHAIIRHIFNKILNSFFPLSNVLLSVFHSFRYRISIYTMKNLIHLQIRRPCCI